MPRVANSKPSNFSPNTYHTCWSDRRLLVRASRPLEKGELITICKVPPLLISLVWWDRVAVGRVVKGLGEDGEVCEGGVVDLAGGQHSDPQLSIAVVVWWY